MNQKIKIMDRQPQVSDEEVKGYMDFDNLLHQHKKIVHRRNLMFRSGAIVLVLATLVTVYITYSGKPPEARDQQAPTQTLEHDSLASRHAHVTDTASTREPVVSQTDVSRNKTQDVSGITREHREPKDEEVPVETPSSPQRPEEVKPENAYVQAEPLDGYEKLFEYFRSNLQYPQEALADSVEGVVTVSFVITTEGKADNITIRNSLGDAFDREATTLISRMPPWKPATLNGKAVPSKVSLPLNFELKKFNP